MSPFYLLFPDFICTCVRKAVVVLAAAFGVLLICSPLFAQGSYGRILGAVTDQSGGVMAGVTVTILDVDRGVSRTLTTDDAGEYNAPNLVPGKYTVRAEAKGFKTVERQNIVLETGKEPRVDLSMQPGEQTQTVTVTESIPLVETTNATMGGTLGNAEIVDLPLNGRNYQNLLGLRPGVMLQPGGGPWTQSTNGIRPDETVWMVDGVINSNFFDARPVANMPSPFTDGATILPVDAIQEFNVMENPKAEYGWKPGAVVNVGVKSGTNNLHGSAYAFGRSDAFDARNYFNPVPIGGVCAGNPGTPIQACDKLATELKQFGGVVGGPIKKDKLFFFAGYEGLRSLIGSAFTANVPGTGPGAGPAGSMVDAIQALQAAGVPRSAVSEKLLGCTEPTALTATCTGGLYAISQSNPGSQLSPFPNNNVSDNGIAKIDYHINSKQQLTGTFFLGNYSADGEDHGFVNEAFADNVPIRTWSNVESWIWTPSSQIVNELRFGYDRVDFSFINNDVGVRADGVGYPLNTGVTNPLIGGLPNIAIGSSFASLGTTQNRPQYVSPNPYYDIQDSVSYLKGKHSFKFGFEFAHIEADSNIAPSGRGQVFFNGGGQFGNTSTPMEDFFAGLPTKAVLLAGSPARRATFISTSGFAQDDWRITPKLIINLGLRYMYNSPMKEVNGLFGSFDPTLGMVQQGQQISTLWKPDRRDFEPRIGFAWDVNGNGTTVVRGGASLIHETEVLFTWMAEFSLQNNGSTSIAAVPTAATLVTAGCTGLGVCSPAATTPGTIGLNSATFTSGLHWKDNSTTQPLFPASTGAVCGDGIGADPGPCDIMGVDPNLRTPYAVNFNISVQHAFTPNLSLEVGYVGNHGSRLILFRDINQAPLGAGWCLNALTPAQKADACAAGPTAESVGAVTGGLNSAAVQEARPYFSRFPYLRFINWGSNAASSWYHSLQATLTKRMSRGLSFTAGYTYGHGTDNGSLNRFGLLPQDSTRPTAEWASSDFDIRHRFTLTATYNIPGKSGFGQMLEGWQINSIVNAQTAQPWTVSDSTFNLSGIGENADRWDFVGNPADFKSGPTSVPYCSGFGGTVTCGENTLYGPVSLPASLASKCTAAAPDPITLAAAGCWVSPNGQSVMVPAAFGQFGTMGRNLFRDTGFRSWDMSVFKNFHFKERFTAQFRVEFFNILNQPLFANPYGASNAYLGGIDPSSGAASAPGNLGYSGATPDFAAGSPIISSGANRDMQLGLKLTF